MNTLEHPQWCDPTLCDLDRGGTHLSRPVKITALRSRQPRVQLLLVGPLRGPVRIRLVTVSDLIINSVDVSTEFAARLADHLGQLVAVASKDQPNG